MIVSCLAPLLAVACFAAAAPMLARAAAPRVAIWTLGAGGLALAGCSVAALTGVVATGLGGLPPLARMGHWSAGTVAAISPFRPWAVLTAAALLAAAVLGVVLALLRHGRRLRSAWAASRAVPSGLGLVVLADPQPFAYAIPGWPGRIVASRGLLQRLDARGRRALLAHEQAHLSERHDLHLAAATLAAGLNPLLWRLPAALDQACERRADEVAVHAVGDPGVVAQAIAAAACPQLEHAAFGADGADVTRRVRMLLADPPGHRPVSWLLTSTTLAAVAGSALSVLWLAHDLGSVLAVARG